MLGQPVNGQGAIDRGVENVASWEANFEPAEIKNVLFYTINFRCNCSNTTQYMD